MTGPTFRLIGTLPDQPVSFHCWHFFHPETANRTCTDRSIGGRWTKRPPADRVGDRLGAAGRHRGPKESSYVLPPFVAFKLLLFHLYCFWWKRGFDASFPDNKRHRWALCSRGEWSVMERYPFMEHLKRIGMKQSRLGLRIRSQISLPA